MIVTIYIACPLDRLEKAQDYAARLRKVEGYNIVSTWHDVVSKGTSDPLEEEDRARIAVTCLAEVRKAQLVVGYTAGGTPRGTFFELGAALALGIPIVLGVAPVGRVNRTAFDSHPLITKFSSDEEMESYVERCVGRVLPLHSR